MSDPDPSSGPPETVPESEQRYNAFQHLSAFAGMVLPLGFEVVVPGPALLLPLTLWLLGRHRSSFTDHHGREAVNFNFTMSFIYVPVAVASAGPGFVLCTAIFMGIWMSFSVHAALQALKGRNFRYRLSLRPVSDN